MVWQSYVIDLPNIWKAEFGTSQIIKNIDLDVYIKKLAWLILMLVKETNVIIADTNALAVAISFLRSSGVVIAKHATIAVAQS